MQTDQPAVRAQGAVVPKIGFGTWLINGRDCEEAVRDALEIGYRHLDTAAAYENEREVGRGIAASGVPREQIFLTTKVWMDDLEPAALRRSAERSLRALGTDYVDLLLVHWPNDAVPVGDTVGAMDELRAQGRVRHLGVSNFPAGMVREALAHGPLLCDQVEYHPHLEQEALLALADEEDLVVAAYSPLGHGELIADPELGEIGAAHGKTAAQVALRWLIEEERVVALPKASSHANRAANFDVFDFSLSTEEKGRIDAMPKDRRGVSPSWAPDWDA